MEVDGATGVKPEQEPVPAITGPFGCKYTSARRDISQIEPQLNSKWFLTTESAGECGAVAAVLIDFLI